MQEGTTGTLVTYSSVCLSETTFNLSSLLVSPPDACALAHSHELITSPPCVSTGPPAVETVALAQTTECKVDQVYAATYGRTNLDLSRVHDGSRFRLAKVLDKARRGDKIKVALLGGSVSTGHGYSLRGDSAERGNSRDAVVTDSPTASLSSTAPSSVFGGIPSEMVSNNFWAAQTRLNSSTAQNRPWDPAISRGVILPHLTCDFFSVSLLQSLPDC